MKPSTQEWVDKAEADFASARRELRARRQPNFDAACFHARQCIEKHLKARLVEAGIRFAKVHDLQQLLDAVLPVEPLWEPFRSKLGELTSFAVAFRYPGESATREPPRQPSAIAPLFARRSAPAWDWRSHDRRRPPALKGRKMVAQGKRSAAPGCEKKMIPAT